MGQILLIISIVVALLTAALGFVNRNKLNETTANLESTQTSLSQTKESLAKAESDLKTAQEQLESATAEKDQLATNLQSTKTQLEQASSKVSSLESQVNELNTQIAQLREDLKQKEEQLLAASGAAPAEDSSGNVVADLQAQLSEKEQLLSSTEAKLAETAAQLKVLQEKEQQRLAQTMRDGLEGRILAVNPMWNFVVLNIGDRNGVIPNAELLVKRGTRLVGKVRVTSVEPSTSIADIVRNSVPPGFSIQPGDNVIYVSASDAVN